MNTQHIGTSQTTDSIAQIDTQASTPDIDKKSNRLAIVVSLVALYFLWGTTYLCMRIALQSFPPFLLAGIRFFIAGMLMFGFLRARGAPLPTRKEWLGAILIGALLLIGGNGGVTFAEQWVPSGLSAVATGAVPLWAALFAGFFGRWPSRFEWIGLALGFAGLLLLNLGNGLTASWSPGAVVLLFSPISWALGSVLSQRVSLPKGFMATAAQLLSGGLLLLLISLASGERITHTPSISAIGAMVFLIVGGSLVAYTAYGYLLSHVRSSLATSYAYVNPVVAVALGVWLANEQITAISGIAMLIILAGVVLVTVTRGHKHKH
ncbi:MAG TPA: drug/metabolite exporter YedA [Ktedonobacteraceae bacterium]|jgi:drug/metabolite transporter (DMT)-like permease